MATLYAVNNYSTEPYLMTGKEMQALADKCKTTVRSYIWTIVNDEGADVVTLELTKEELQAIADKIEE